MDGLTCKNCNQMLYVPPNVQHIRCFRCKSLYPIGNTNVVVHHSRIPPSPLSIHCFGGEIVYLAGNTSDTSDVVHNKGTKEWSLEFLCRKRKSFSNMQQSQTWMPSLATSLTDQPPRGRRAFLCGVSYRKQKHELKRTAQDVRSIRDLLVQAYGFPTESILILAEGEPYYLPTRKNIEDGFQWLMRGIQPGDSLVFYFSGHGKRQRDFIRDERDGFDETICPVDFEKNGMILDNYINEAIVRPLIQDVTLHAIMDSCHSGTVLDLPKLFDVNIFIKSKWVDNSPPSGAYKGTNGGTAICFSACEDYQLAADTSAFLPENEMTGAMTITFILAVRAALDKDKSISYQDIMNSMHQTIKQADKSGGFFAGIRRIFHRRILQDPVLSSSKEFNTSTEFNL